jgi:ElaB/YqjD/DUF883 family membrane-anchored ribosome-binding protein
MPTDPVPERPELGPDAGVDDIQADIEATRKELGDTIEALSAKADISGRAKQKVVQTQSHIAETATHAVGSTIEKAHAAQSAAREIVTKNTGSVKRSVPIAGVAVAAGIALIGVVVWRRRGR